jgi:hypothetical protein
MLDEEHEPPTLQNGDDTLYTLGRVHGHYVVIACLPAGRIGIASAATIATRLADRFPNAKIGSWSVLAAASVRGRRPLG